MTEPMNKCWSFLFISNHDWGKWEYQFQGADFFRGDFGTYKRVCKKCGTPQYKKFYIPTGE